MLSFFARTIDPSGKRVIRREVLRAGLVGLSTSVLSTGAATGSPNDTPARSKKSFGRAKSCIFIFNFGGPSQLETFDMKPKAPDNIRGEFKPISTRVPSTTICEHLPLLAARTHQYAILRSLSHRDIEHQSGGYTGLTGHRHPNPRVFAAPTPDDTPPIGSVVSKLRPTTRSVPSFVAYPTVLFDAVTIPGQDGGWLGKKHDPLLLRQDPNSASFSVQEYALRRDLTPERVGGRRELLEQLQSNGGGAPSGASTQALETHYRKAFDLLSTSATRSAFDIKAETAKVRERYGRTIFGQSCLLARRLVEAGVPVINIYYCHGGLTGLQASRPWDTHEGNFSRLKRDLLPDTDRAFSTLLDELTERGLLDETLIAWSGEFGRTPRIGARSSPNGAKADGRDHWPYCYSALLAGGGVKGGVVHGASDSAAGHPIENAVTPADFAATIYHCLGIDPRTEIRDTLNRPFRFCEGSPVAALLT